MKKPGFEPMCDSEVKASNMETTLMTMLMTNVYIVPDTSELFYPPNIPDTWTHHVFKLHNQLEVR